MIGGYIQHGHYLSGLKLYERMEKEGPDPDQAIYVSLLSACGSLGITSRGQILHCEINAHGWNGDTAVGNSLLDTYVRCEALQEAEIVFNGMDRREEVSCHACSAWKLHNVKAVFERYGRRELKTR